MISKEDFDKLLLLLGEQAQKDIDRFENLRAPNSAEEFAEAVIYVICNSGMKNSVAQNIYAKCLNALKLGNDPCAVFGHKTKCAAIKYVWDGRQHLYNEIMPAIESENWNRVLNLLKDLPWIGDITKYHLAKNLGANVAKPDIHLMRLANVYGTTPHGLCDDLARKTGYKIATIDTLLWRACTLRILDSHVGLRGDSGGD